MPLKRNNRSKGIIAQKATLSSICALFSPFQVIESMSERITFFTINMYACGYIYMWVCQSTKSQMCGNTNVCGNHKQRQKGSLTLKSTTTALINSVVIVRQTLFTKLQIQHFSNDTPLLIFSFIEKNLFCEVTKMMMSINHQWSRVEQLLS